MLKVTHRFCAEGENRRRELREAAHRQCVRKLLARPGCTALTKTS